jgi:dihydroceramidase
MAFEWMSGLPSTMRVGFVLWGSGLVLFAWVILEEQSGVKVHKSHTPILKHGYWGRPTSNIDWCENNYAVSPYVAEFWNAISSVSFLVTALIGSWLTIKYKLENRFLICFLSIFIMGFGSILFHATLLRTTQMLDELPMIFSTLTFMYILGTMQDHTLETEKRKSHQRRLGLSLTLIGVGFSILYFLFPENPTVLQTAFVALVCYVCWESFNLYLKYRIDTQHPEAKQMLEISMFSFFSGSFLWLIEPRVCAYVGWMNLHAWWHILVCYGIYLCVLFYKYVRLAALGKRPSIVPISTPTLLPSVLPLI